MTDHFLFDESKLSADDVIVIPPDPNTEKARHEEKTIPSKKSHPSLVDALVLEMKDEKGELKQGVLVFAGTPEKNSKEQRNKLPPKLKQVLPELGHFEGSKYGYSGTTLHWRGTERALDFDDEIKPLGLPVIEVSRACLPQVEDLLFSYAASKDRDAFYKQHFEGRSFIAEPDEPMAAKKPVAPSKPAVQNGNGKHYENGHASAPEPNGKIGRLDKHVQRLLRQRNPGFEFSEVTPTERGLFRKDAFIAAMPEIEKPPGATCVLSITRAATPAVVRTLLAKALGLKTKEEVDKAITFTRPGTANQEADERYFIPLTTEHAIKVAQAYTIPMRSMSDLLPPAENMDHLESFPAPARYAGNGRH